MYVEIICFRSKFCEIHQQKKHLFLQLTGEETGYHQCWAITQFGQLEPPDGVPITRNQTGTWPQLEVKPGYKIEFGSGTGTGTWAWF